MNKRIVLVDAGHGSNTGGKRSPDGTLMEYEYARKIKAMLIEKLKKNGFEAYDICPETYDVSITTRVRRANNEVKKHKEGGVLISIHSNAAGSDGKWHEGRGWEVLVSLNASLNSKRLATCLADSAEEVGLKVRKGATTKYKQQNLGICRESSMPAVLVENFFHDNKEEVKFALTEVGMKTYTDILYNGLMKYMA